MLGSAQAKTVLHRDDLSYSLSPLEHKTQHRYCFTVLILGFALIRKSSQVTSSRG